MYLKSAILALNLCLKTNNHFKRNLLTLRKAYLQTVLALLNTVYISKIRLSRIDHSKF